MWSLVKTLLGMKTEYTLLYGVRYHGSTHRLWPDCHMREHPTIESFRFVIDCSPEDGHVTKGKIDATLRYWETRRFFLWQRWSRHEVFKIDYRVTLFHPDGVESFPLSISLSEEPPVDITELLAHDIHQLFGDYKNDYIITVIPTELNTFPFED